MHIVNIKYYELNCEVRATEEELKMKQKMDMKLEIRFHIKLYSV